MAMESLATDPVEPPDGKMSRAWTRRSRRLDQTDWRHLDSGPLRESAIGALDPAILPLGIGFDFENPGVEPFWRQSLAVPDFVGLGCGNGDALFRSCSARGGTGFDHGWQNLTHISSQHGAG